MYVLTAYQRLRRAFRWSLETDGCHDHDSDDDDDDDDDDDLDDDDG